MLGAAGVMDGAEERRTVLEAEAADESSASTCMYMYSKPFYIRLLHDIVHVQRTILH